MLTDRKIGVLMGGASAEREVSLRSGNAVFGALKRLGYNAVSIDTGSDACNALKKEGVDIAFIVLHGGWGEDGSIQGLLDVMGIPYTGSGVLSSALAMDKEASKKIFIYHGIPVPRFEVINNAAGFEPSATGFEMPWVVKPVCEGSSVGVNIVRDRKQLKDAVESAFSYGEKIIVEQFIEGREIQIGILNDRALGGVEIKTSLEFYNYEAKYTPGFTEYILPPDMDGKIYKKAEDVALASHKALGCRGATRVDLRIDNKGDSYVLEVNTIPGMTETSLLPKIAAKAGMDFSQLIEEMLREAIERENK